MRFFFYSHDAVGLGHLRRHLAIGAALAEAAPESKVLLATSVDEVANLGLPANVDTLKLPGLRKLGNNQYASRRLALPPSEIRFLRTEILHAAVKAFRPAVVLVDKHPLGAGAEMQPALEAARAAGARAVLGLRDILDEPDVVRHEWSERGVPERIAEFYDLILIYGNDSVFDPVEEYRFPAALAERTKYCCYVVNHVPCQWHPGGCPYLTTPASPPLPTVLGTTGGGEDGFLLLKTFIKAAAGASWNAVAVAGPRSDPEEFQILQEMAVENRVTLHNFIPCLANLFGSVDGLVCMGGYNTLVEAISKGLPVVCVPRIKPRAEQLVRAELFQKLGLLSSVHPNQLTADNLRRAVNAELVAPRAARLSCASQVLDFNGAQRAAQHLLGVLSSREISRTGLAHAII